VSSEAAWPNPVPPVKSPEETGAVAAVADRPAHESDVAKLAAGAGVALGGKLAGRGVRLMVDIALARFLGPLNFGFYAIGWTITRIVTLISPLGLNIGVIRYGSRYWHKDPARLKGVVVQSLVSSVVSGVVFGLALFLLAPWIGQGIFHKTEVVSVIRWFAFVFPLITGLTTAAAATRVSHRMKFGAFAEDMSEPIVQILLVVLFWLLGWGLAGSIGACIGGYGFALVLALVYVRRLFPEVTASVTEAIFPGKELFSFSIPASLTGVFGVLLIWVDRLFVGYYRPASEVGIYQAASQLSIAFAIILSGFNSIFAPMAADLFHRGELGRLEELYRVTTKWGLYLSLPPFVVTCFAPRLIMGVLFGKAYVAGWPVLLILTFAQLVNASTGPVGYLLVMAGYQKRMFQISGTTFLLAVVLGLILVPRYGITGAAIATGTALSAMFVAAVVFARVAMRMLPYDKRYLKGALATGLAAVPLLLLHNVHISTALVTVAINSVLACAVFAATLIAMGLDTEDRKFIHMIRGRLQPGLARTRQEV
jgi:O-antigen/teichoic acid export membrane protein